MIFTLTHTTFKKLKKNGIFVILGGLGFSSNAQISVSSWIQTATTKSKALSTIKILINKLLNTAGTGTSIKAFTKNQHCKTKLIKIELAALYHLLMTKHPPFRYIKPGPRLLDHFAIAHEPEAK